jgi:hypothetical protein
MIKPSLILALSAVLLITIVSCQNEPDAYNEDAATLSVTTWLKFIDSGNYQRSWESASEFFKTQINADDWVKTAIKARSPLGEVVSRKMISQLYKTAIQGAPDGEYVVIEFSTEFENKKSATETITPVLDPDGQWRVSGYYIR